MSVRPEILLLILACMAVTIVPRVAPMALVNRLRLPAWFLAWLSYIPVSVISALFFREAFLSAGAWRSWDDPYLVAGMLTLAVAFLCRNFFLTAVIGAFIFTACRYLL